MASVAKTHIDLRKSSIPSAGPSTQTVSRESTISAFLFSTFVCSLMLVLFVLTTPQARHWFIVPVLMCGILIGTDVVLAIRGQIDIFEPVGFVAIIAFHFFFLAPFLHVRWDFWMQYVTHPDDWRHWLGVMSLLNSLGILCFLGSRNLVLRFTTSRRRESVWKLKPQTFRTQIAIALTVTALLQGFVYLQFGGISGYISAYEEQTGEFEGFGIIFGIAESFPVLAMMAFVVWAKDRPSRQSWTVLVLAILGFFIARFLFGGLRGSRGNTIWAVFWAAGLIHVWVRLLPRKILLVGAICAIAFMYGYGFYKSLKTDIFDVINNQGGIAALEEESGRSFEGMILGDLARSDVQALILARIWPTSEGVNYEYARGGTYIGGVSLLIPRWIWQDRPPTKTTAGTEALYGEGSSQTRSQLSSRAYGLAGEAMLNFGALAVPIAYAGFGVLVGSAQRWKNSLRSGDSRLLLAPLVTVCAFYFLVWDSDNIVFFTFKNGLVPVLIVVASSTRVAKVSMPTRADATQHGFRTTNPR